jgi:hypothetical protein
VQAPRGVRKHGKDVEFALSGGFRVFMVVLGWLRFAGGWRRRRPAGGGSAEVGAPFGVDGEEVGICRCEPDWGEVSA